VADQILMQKVVDMMLMQKETDNLSSDDTTENISTLHTNHLLHPPTHIFAKDYTLLNSMNINLMDYRRDTKGKFSQLQMTTW